MANNIFGTYTPLYSTFTGLVAKLAGTMVDVSRITGRQYGFVYSGQLPYGATIEDVFIQPQDVWTPVPDLSVATPNGYQDNTDYDPHGCDRIENPDIITQYFSKNYEAQTAVEISDFWMRAAFDSEYGISDYIGKLIASAESGLRKEKLDKIDSIIAAAIVNSRDQSTTPSQNAQYTAVRVNDENIDPTSISAAAGAETAANLESLMVSISTQIYNMSDRTTGANANGLGAIREDGAENIVMLVHPATYANIRTGVYAKAYNLSQYLPAGLEVYPFSPFANDTLFAIATASFDDSTGLTASKVYRPIAALVSRRWLQDWETARISKDIETPTATNHFITEYGTVLASGVEPSVWYFNQQST